VAVGYSLCGFSEILLYRFEELAFSFNGGKDSTVLSPCSHLLIIISSFTLFIIIHFIYVHDGLLTTDAMAMR
jgi:hypothetical protein